MTPMTDRTKEHLGGLKIVSLGESFTGENYPGGLDQKDYPAGLCLTKSNCGCRN